MPRVIAENHFRMAEVNEVSDEAAGRRPYPQRYGQGREQSLNPQAPCAGGIVFGVRLLEGSQGHDIVARLAQPAAGMRCGSRLVLAGSPSTILKIIFDNHSRKSERDVEPHPFGRL